METFTQANFHKDMAKLAMNKSLLKEYSYNNYNRVVFLNDNDEFQIQLFNPKSKKIAAKIYINDVALSNMIVLKPGERVWLERYLDKAKKFKFSTYEVDSSAEAQNAIRNNGNIRIKFYDEYRYKVSYSSYDFDKFFKTDNNYLNQKYNHISNDSVVNTVRSFCNSVVTNNATPTMFKSDVNCATMDCYEVKSTALTDCYEVNPTSLTFSANTIETGLIVAITKLLPFFENTSYFNLVLNGLMVLIVSTIVVVFINYFCMRSGKEQNDKRASVRNH